MNLYTRQGTSDSVKDELVLTNCLTWAASKLQNMLEKWKPLEMPVLRNDTVQTPTSEEIHAYILTQIMDHVQFAFYPPNAISI